MASSTRRAIYLGEQGELSIKTITEDYKPQGNQALVRVKYSAINPADLKHSYIGLCGSIAGIEWVGTVIEIGDESPFKVGQVLFGQAMPGRQRPVYVGTHQDYILAIGDQYTWPLPSTLSDTDAVAMPTAVGTSVDALFNVMGFAFPAAGIRGRDPTGVPILIWGGASAVGSAAIQVARAAGFDPVLTTASPKNHDYLKEAGATHVFDYNSPTIVDDIKGAVALTGKRLSVMFDAVSSGLGQLGSEKPEPNNTPDLAKSCASDGVSAEDLVLSAVLPVPHDPSWLFCIGIRTYGDKFFLGTDVSQDPSWPIRMKAGMDWVMNNHEKVWKPILRTTIVRGAERGIAEIRRVADGRASREKVLIAHPM